MHQTLGNSISTTSTLGTLYTPGYTAEGAGVIVDDLLALDVTIVDVRYQAASIRPFWDQMVLSAWLGKYYWHLPALGNTTYAHRGQPITLADPDKGIPLLVAHLVRGESLALLVRVCRGGALSPPPGGRVGAGAPARSAGDPSAYHHRHVPSGGR